MQNTNDIKEFWGTLDGQEVFLYHLTNSNNVKISITNFGASITEIITPDKKGTFSDIALGYDQLADYVNDEYYVGAIVGRFANRIAGSKIELDGDIHQIFVNEKGFHHHGGKVGFNKKVWESSYTTNSGHPAVKLQYLSPDGEEGFPGNLLVTVIYTLNDDNQLIVNFSATTDKITILNLTQHSYFNLAGHNKGNIEDHFLTMPLDHYLPVDQANIPNGELAKVDNTPFDFRNGKILTEQISEQHEQMLLGSGYDHSWVIKRENSAQLKVAARVFDQGSGRALVVYTTEPAVHLYTANFLDVRSGKGGVPYGKRSAFCLETQQFPDAPNKKHFPNTILRKGEVFQSKTIFEFGTV